MGKFIDLTGKIFGRLTVIKRVNDKIEPSGRRKTMWLCRCDCDGKEVIIYGSNLTKNNGTKSCGCLQKERVSKLFKRYNTYDLLKEYGIGYTFKGEEFWFDLEDYDLIKNYNWCLDNDMYVVTTDIDNKKINRMHRLVMNCPDDMEVDHIFHNKWDNRKSKLRIVTRSQNGMNQVTKTTNTSGVKGVKWNEKSGKWISEITVNNKYIYLGIYDNFDIAVKVRKEAELKYFGEYRYIEK